MNRRTAVAGVGVGVGVFGLAGTAQADFQVDTTADDVGLVTCGVAAGDCSLRGALSNANGNGTGLDVISFASNVTGSITLLTGQLPTITGSTYITGPGADVLAIDGNLNG